MKPIRLTFWSVKGGVGKTIISLNFALHFNAGIITNERYTLLDKILPKEKFLKLSLDQDIPNIPREHSVIFDMGGYLDKRVKHALQQSDYVIIPTTSDKLDLQGTISTIGEIKGINNNIIIVANKTENQEDLKLIKDLISQIGDYPVFEIKKSRALKGLIIEKKSIQNIQKEGGLKGYILKSLAKQFDDLGHFILNH